MNGLALSAKLTELRKAKGMTQEEIAAAFQISNKTISKWENGTSAPDIQMLIKLARYYNVSTDTLLGLDNKEKTTKNIIEDEFKGLDKHQTILKVFDIIKSIYPATFNTICRDSDITYDELPPIPKNNNRRHQFRIMQESFFNYAICADDVNFSVMQWRNNANFAWLLEPEKQNRIVKFLSFLADADVLKVMHFIHSDNCSETFTVEYIAKNAKVSTEKAEIILNKCCELEMASKIDAHLKDKDIYIYGTYGDGLILAILSIAYQKMNFNHNYEYNLTKNLKMIRGEKVQ